MLRLNASVHSWLTRQEMKLAKARAQAHAEAQAQAPIDEQHQQAAAAGHDSATQMDELHNDEEELLHAQLKNEVGDMYSVWDEADARLVVCILWYVCVCVSQQRAQRSLQTSARTINSYRLNSHATRDTPLDIRRACVVFACIDVLSVRVFAKSSPQPLPHSHGHTHTHIGQGYAINCLY